MVQQIEGEEEQASLSAETASLGRALWATILGLAFARCSTIIGSYGSYRATDSGLYTDGATLVAMAVLLVLMALIAATKARLHKRQVNAIMRMLIVLQFVLLCFMFTASWLGEARFPGLQGDGSLWFALHALNTLFGYGMTFYWLRYMRGSNSFTAIGVIALSVMLSEIVLLVSAFLPEAVSFAFAAALVASEFAMMRQSRKVPRPYEVESGRAESGRATDLLLSFASESGGMNGVEGASAPSQRQFLINMGVGIGLLSVVIGLLRGYPDGASIPFTMATRITYFAIIVALMALAVYGAHKGRRQMISQDVWVIAGLLASVSLLLFAFFPSELEIGAVTVTVLNAVMVGYIRYAAVAFMGYGWRDPYYYAIGGFAVFLVPRAVMRMIEMALFVQLGVNEEQIGAIIAFCLVLFMMVIFVQAQKLNDAARNREIAAENAEREAEFQKEKSGLLERFMGLDNEDAPESMEDVRLRAMKANAEKIGETFLLSDREVEVLALYAMGHTQKRVAEELYIAPATVHAHIKRIYSKTGLHSRQAILDYMSEYCG